MPRTSVGESAVRIGKSLSGTEDIRLKLVTTNKGERVLIYNNTSNSPHCGHYHKEKSLIRWLENHGSIDRICPKCVSKETDPKLSSATKKLEKLSMSNACMSSTLVKGRSVHMEDSDEYSGDDVQDESMNSDYSEEDDDDLGEFRVEESADIPDWIKPAILEHYTANTMYDDFDSSLLAVRDAYSGDTIIGKGIFNNTPENILKGTHIGNYKGIIIWDPEYVKSLKPTKEMPVVDKILEINLFGARFYIDATEHWTGILNHKWAWPWAISEVPIPVDCQPYFSNVETSEDGDMKTIRIILRGEELTFDYGQDYWVGRRPYWSLSNTGSPNLLLEKLILQKHELCSRATRSILLNCSPGFQKAVNSAAAKMQVYDKEWY